MLQLFFAISASIILLFFSFSHFVLPPLFCSDARACRLSCLFSLEFFLSHSHPHRRLFPSHLMRSPEREREVDKCRTNMKLLKSKRKRERKKKNDIANDLFSLPFTFLLSFKLKHTQTIFSPRHIASPVFHSPAVQSPVIPSHYPHHSTQQNRAE